MAAKTYFWTGTDGDGDIENPTGNNWVEENGTPAGAGVYPGSVQADHVVFDGRALAAPLLNLDQAANANGILDLAVRKGFAFALGAIAAPLVWKIAAGSPVWRFEGTEHGALYLVATTAALAEVHVMATPDDDASALNLVTAVAVTEMRVIGGRVLLPKSLFGVTAAGVATLNVAAKPNAAAPIVRSWQPVTTVLNLHGGDFYWNEGALTQYYNFGGALRCQDSTIARTMTSGTQYAGSTDLRTGKSGTITLTNPLVYDGGQQPQIDTGATVHVA